MLLGAVAEPAPASPPNLCVQNADGHFVLFEHPWCLFWMLLLNKALQETLHDFTFSLASLGLEEGTDPGYAYGQHRLFPDWDRVGERPSRSALMGW